MCLSLVFTKHVIPLYKQRFMVGLHLEPARRTYLKEFPGYIPREATFISNLLPKVIPNIPRVYPDYIRVYAEYNRTYPNHMLSRYIPSISRFCPENTRIHPQYALVGAEVKALQRFLVERHEMNHVLQLAFSRTGIIIYLQGFVLHSWSLFSF